MDTLGREEGTVKHITRNDSLRLSSSERMASSLSHERIEKHVSSTVEKHAPSALPYRLRGEETCVVVVDAVRDFFDDDGAFAACYGKEDVEPVRRVLPALEDLALAWSGQCRVLCCRSRYHLNQFGVAGLENLCTTERGRELRLPRGYFDDVVDKVDNSILTSPKIQRIFKEHRALTHLVLAGVTTTSCIARSIADIRSALRHLQVVVPCDAIASRGSRQGDEHRLLRAWGSRQEKGVWVVPSWKDIEIGEGPRAA